MPKEGVSKTSHDDILSVEEIVEVARIFEGLGIKKIRITGGEPLIRKGGIVDILQGIGGI